MSKYRHMTDHEIVSHVDKFGTEDEKSLLSAIWPLPPEADDCVRCAETRDEIAGMEDGIEAAIKALEEVRGE